LNGGASPQDEFNRGVHAAERILQLERLTRRLRGAAPLKLLDFGCGEGHFLATSANFGFECHGVEFSSAREKTKRVEFYNDLEQLKEEMPSARFHAVVLFEVLEHLAEPLRILRELRPLLMSGGILILETPDCENVTSIDDRISYDLIGPLGHINAFTSKTLKTIAAKAAFEPIKTSVVQCSADPVRVYKREAKRFLRGLIRPTTRQFFRAV
jgi:2-polyprenyl-3-methyl-5-hydroxy-6-metoxy-1,4-benzoquinol methylase